METLLPLGENMVKNISTPLLAMMLASTLPLSAGVGDFIWGGVAGGLIASAIVSKPDVVVVEQPVYYEPVLVEEPYVVYEQPTIIYEKPIQTRTCTRSCRPKKEIVRETIVETRTVTAPKQDTDKKNRELALKEQQMELDLIREKTELLREENRRKELALKEKELNRKRIKALEKEEKDEREERALESRANKETRVEKTVTTTVKKARA